MDVQVAQNLFKAVDDSLNSTLSTGTASLMTAAGAFFFICWLIHFNLKAIDWLWAGFDSTIQDLIMTLFRATFIIYFAFHVDLYIRTVVPFVTELPPWAAQKLSISGGSQTNMVDALISSYVTAVLDTASAMKFNFFTTDFDVIALGILAFIFLLVGGIPYILLCVGTLITLKFATTIILVVGPVFIAFSLFPVTRQYFFGWVSILAGFMLTQIFFAVALTLQMNFLNTFVIKGGEIQTDLVSCFSILLYFGSFTILASELPTYAASIMGGAPTGTTGVGGILGKTMGVNQASKVAKGAGNLLNRMRNRNKIS